MNEEPPCFSISVDTHQYLVQEESLSEIISRILLDIGLPNADLSVVMTNSEMIQNLNAKYRGKDKPTDVLSFPQVDWETPLNRQVLKELNSGPCLLGDLIICPEIAEANAQSLSQSLEQEIVFLIIHGILHLCGFDHKEPLEEKQMIAKQKSVLESLVSSTKDDPLPRNFIRPRNPC